MKKITRIAVKTKDKIYSEPVPSSHAQVREKHGLKGTPRAERGFIDEKGNFLSREQAADVALKAKQVEGVAEVKKTGKLHSHNVKRK